MCTSTGKPTGRRSESHAGPNNDSCALCWLQESKQACISSFACCEKQFTVILSLSTSLLLLYHHNQLQLHRHHNTHPPSPPCCPLASPLRAFTLGKSAGQIKIDQLRPLPIKSLLSLLSLPSLPPTLAQRPNRLPISYRRARRLGLLQTLSEDAHYSPPPPPPPSPLLPAIRSLLLRLLRT